MVPDALNIPRFRTRRAFARIILVSVAGMVLASCSQIASEIGKPPVLSQVGQELDPSQLAYESYPERPPSAVSRFSTWNDRASSLFTTKRALAQGDILTVLISIDDKAQLTNKSDRSRTSGMGIGLSGDISADGFGHSASANGTVDSSTDFTGTGGTTRAETIKLSVAAVVVRVFQNGNLLIKGSQEVRVNAEMRILTIEGMVRPSDIEPNNTISYERIAEARISYGGRGRITEVQQPPWGHQIITLISPL